MGTSRPGKRKANSKAKAVELSGPEAEEQQTEEVEAEDEREREELREAVTPEKSDLDEIEDEDDLDALSSTQPPKRGVGAKGKAIEEVTADEPGSPEEAPPRRELPFTRHNLRKKPTEAPPKPAEDEGDESTDDEL